MQQHPNASGGGRCALPPTPLQLWFICQGNSSHRHTSSHKNKEKNGRTQQDMQHEQMQQHPMHLGGRRCTLPPQPPSSLFLRMTPLTATPLFQEHTKNQKT